MKKNLSLILLLFSLVATDAQINYFVSSDFGTDEPDLGLSESAPFKTLNYAVEFLQAGDTLNVLEGIYYNENYGDGDIWKKEKTIFLNNKQGTANAYITVRPYEDHVVKLRGDGIYIFQIRNSTYIRVEGFDIEGEVENIPLDSALAYQFAYREEGSDEILYRVPPGTPADEVAAMVFEPLENIDRPAYFDTKGLLVQSSHHIEITNNHIHHAPGTGLRFNGCGYVYAIANEINDCSRRSYAGTHALVFEACDDMNNSTETKIWIQRNYVHHNYNEIYSWAPSKTFITPVIDEGKGISMQRNDVERGWEFGRIRIENNLTHHNGFSGFHTNTGRGIDFVNNTSYHDSYTGLGNNHGFSAQNSEDISFINNIVANDTTLGGNGIAVSNSSSDYIVKNNLVNGAIDADVDAVDVNTIFANPLFTNPQQFDFTLEAGSPAIGTASVTDAPADDFTGMLRIFEPDRGAFESPFATAVSSIDEVPAILVYPNPFNDFLIVKTDDSSQKVSLFDILGREVTNHIQRINGVGSIQLNTAGLDQGIYILKTENTNSKVIKYSE